MLNISIDFSKPEEKRDNTAFHAFMSGLIATVFPTLVKAIADAIGQPPQTHPYPVKAIADAIGQPPQTHPYPKADAAPVGTDGTTWPREAPEGPLSDSKLPAVSIGIQGTPFVVTPKEWPTTVSRTVSNAIFKEGFHVMLPTDCWPEFNAWAQKWMLDNTLDVNAAKTMHEQEEALKAKSGCCYDTNKIDGGGGLAAKLSE